MSEAACRSKLIDILKTMTTVFPADTVTGEIPVNTGKFTVLDLGVTNAAIFYVGRMESEQTVNLQTGKTWDILFDLFHRTASDEATDWGAFGTLRDAVIAEIDSYPSLGGIATAVEVFADADPLKLKRDPAGVVFIWEAMRVRVHQIVPITLKE